MTPDDLETAGLILAKCAANDPWFPKGGDAIVAAWAEAFAESGLTREDLLDGVTHAYRVEQAGFRPLPGAIVHHARVAYFEALRELPDERRAAMDDACHALQEMGFTPPEAHRYARAVALGHTPERALSPTEVAELRARLAERREVAASEPRPVLAAVASIAARRRVRGA